MNVGEANFTIYQGSKFEKVFKLVDNADDSNFNLTNYSFVLRAKVEVGDTATVIDSEGDDQNLTLAITAPATSGVFTITMTDSETAALDFDTAEYQIEGTISGESSRFYKGIMVLSKDIVV